MLRAPNVILSICQLVEASNAAIKLDTTLIEAKAGYWESVENKLNPETNIDNTFPYESDKGKTIYGLRHEQSDGI